MPRVLASPVWELGRRARGETHGLNPTLAGKTEVSQILSKPGPGLCLRAVETARDTGQTGAPNYSRLSAMLPGSTLVQTAGKPTPSVDEARLGPKARLIWTLSTCLATQSGPTFAPLCAHIFPRRLPGLSGQHQSDSVTTLPSGREFSTDRGAEQGDVLGTIQSALVLGDARESHLRDFLSTPFEQKGVCDGWFVD